MAPAFAVPTLPRPVDGEVAVPGSKSLTNRALVAAALSAGTSRIDGMLDADDTRRMRSGLAALGVSVEVDGSATAASVVGRTSPAPGGSAPRTPGGEVLLDVGLAGTVARFLLPLSALDSVQPEATPAVVVDGTTRMRERPMADLIDALRTLGARIDELGVPGHLPLRVHGGLRGGIVRVPGDVSSQFVSGLLLCAPAMPEGLDLEVTDDLVSRPYVAMTLAVMSAFGVEPEVLPGRFRVPAGAAYRATRYAVEPDASSASYVLAAAAITGSRLRVPGLGPGSVQGDARFGSLLAEMGAELHLDDAGTAVFGPDPAQPPGAAVGLEGIDADLADMSDVAQTLAAVAVFARTPTRIRGIGFIRAKESDRIAATVAELGRCGIEATAEPDGLVVYPGTPRGATVQTWGDHRVAMSMALLGLRCEGILVDEPAVVDKTFPGYFSMLASLGALPPLERPGP